ncbi:MAG: hypothetical protein ACUVWP_00225 [bacterium]
MPERRRTRTSTVKTAKSELDNILEKITSSGFDYAFVIDEDGLTLSDGAGNIPKDLIEEISIIAKRIFNRISDFLGKRPKEAIIDIYIDGNLIIRPLVVLGEMFILAVKVPYKKRHKRFLSNIEKEIISFIKGST